MSTLRSRRNEKSDPLKDDRPVWSLQAKLPFKDQDKESRVIEVFNRLLDRLENAEAQVAKLDISRRSIVRESLIH